MKRLPDEFFWTEGEKLVGNSSIDRIIHKNEPPTSDARSEDQTISEGCRLNIEGRKG